MFFSTKNVSGTIFDGPHEIEETIVFLTGGRNIDGVLSSSEVFPHSKFCLTPALPISSSSSSHNWKKTYRKAEAQRDVLLRKKQMFFWILSKSYIDNGRLRVTPFYSLISVTHNIKGFHVKFAIGGPPRAKFNDTS